MRKVVTNRGKRGLAAAEQMFLADRIDEPTEAAMFGELAKPAVEAAAGADTARDQAIAAAAEAIAAALIAGLATGDIRRALIDVEGLLTANADILGFRETARTGEVVLDGDGANNIALRATDSDAFAINLFAAALYDAGLAGPIGFNRAAEVLSKGLQIGSADASRFVSMRIVDHPYAFFILRGEDGQVLGELRADGTANLFGRVFGAGGTGGQPIDDSYTQPTWVEDFA